MNRLALSWLVFAAGLPTLASRARGQDNTEPASKAGAPAPDGRVGIEQAVARGIGVLLTLEEGEGEWPYEGVYRVRGEIPIGYRVGGTAIVATALLEAPGMIEDAARREALSRALAFVLSALDDPRMSPEEYNAGYDVRGWGYTYALDFLLALAEAGAVPEGHQDLVRARAVWCIRAIEQTEIPEAGGWNYARPAGRDRVAAPSPFMTAPTVRALVRARDAGHEVDAGAIERALVYLESSRTSVGAVAYSGQPRDGRRDTTPGSVGRMLAVETTLLVAGRSSPAAVRGALDAFLTHWQHLEDRRSKPGTHEGPYGIAPYYFWFAHYYAASAVEALPDAEQPEYRHRLHELIFRVRLEDGSWNDRVFPRSAGYGTAMAVRALSMAAAQE